MSEQDTREQLEADALSIVRNAAIWARQKIEHGEGNLFMLDKYDPMIRELLDRQAAITHELDNVWARAQQTRIAELTAERDEWKAKAESALHENPYVGLVRGKQWERTEISDYYCGRCGWKVTDHDSYCPECGGALHKASNKPDGKFDARKTAEMPETDATKEHIRDFDDTREQLEADLLEWIDIAAYKAFKPERMLEVMLHWLDRQAAITLFVQVENDELAIPINYCPNCGAKK